MVGLDNAVPLRIAAMLGNESVDAARSVHGRGRSAKRASPNLDTLGEQGRRRDAAPQQPRKTGTGLLAGDRPGAGDEYTFVLFAPRHEGRSTAPGPEDEKDEEP